MTRALCLKCSGVGRRAGEDCPRCLGAGTVEVAPDRLPRRRVSEHAQERAEATFLDLFARVARKTNARELARTLAAAFASHLPADPVTAIATRARVDRSVAERAARAYAQALREHARAIDLGDAHGERRREFNELHDEADRVDLQLRLDRMIRDVPVAAE